MTTKRVYRHIDGVTATPIFDDDRAPKFRYRLEIIYEPRAEGETCCVVMQNPSYAGANTSDRSIQALEKMLFLSDRPEFRQIRRVLVINQFAKIQTNGFRGQSEDIGEGNDEAIRLAIQAASIVLIAWGCSNQYEARQQFVFELLRGFPGKQLFRTTKHPSRASYDNFCSTFQIPQGQRFA